jgi:L-ribulokinase
MVAATLCGITRPQDVKRSICAMGHKWMWNSKWGGLPPQEFLSRVDPLFDGVRDTLQGDYRSSDAIAGHLSKEWAALLGLRAGIPIPVGAFDAHWDAIGAGCREGDVVNVIGTATCIIAMSQKAQLVPGVCGVVPGSVHPDFTGIEAGLSATGDLFEAIARRAGKSVGELSVGMEKYRGGQTGLLRLSWDNGDRTVLVNAKLGGVTLGWNMVSTAQDELFAAIEGTAFHTRIILDRMVEYGVPVERLIHAGGIPQKNTVLNQIYANVLNRPILVPDGIPTSRGAAIFAFIAAGAYSSIEAAQQAMCLPNREIHPDDPATVANYDRLYALYRKVYFAMGSGTGAPVPLNDVLPQLIKIAAEVRQARA